MKEELNVRDDFVSRHIGPNDFDIKRMLKTLGQNSLNDLISSAAPNNILFNDDLDIGAGLSEQSYLNLALEKAKKNKICKNYIGLGYYDCNTPTVIQRNILENPGWYTAYTPYQAEISQGRMEALLNFQTMVIDLTAMEIANSSLLDEGTAVAEAMTMAYNFQKKNKCERFFVSKDAFPQTIEVIQSRAKPLGIEVVLGDPKKIDFTDNYFACFIQYPSASGNLKDLNFYQDFADSAHKNNSLLVVSADLLSLCLLKPPGEWGADIVVGSSQRFGLYLGFGGPHAAFLACKNSFKRLIPGRIIGLSKDSLNLPALRLALQTREQHIRREKATSNICTAQVLLAVISSMYAVYHGPGGLKRIAERVHHYTWALSNAINQMGYQLFSNSFFDTIQISTNLATEIFNNAAKQNINLALLDKNTLSISLDETTTVDDLEKLISCFAIKDKMKISILNHLDKVKTHFSPSLLRDSKFLTHKSFNSYQSETELLRYIKRLEEKDLSLNHSMIPLGSCTMKLNATTEMIPVTWPELGKIHPFAPLQQAQGYLEIIKQLEKWLKDITGFAAISLQPNAGSQGEYAGLLVINKYLKSKGEDSRNICIIPSSAHGTNPASAVMAGMKVVVVKCDEQGNIDLNDLNEKVTTHSKSLAALMITYPSTHGVFEESIVEICDLIHKHGGQVYMDGANLNALVGISKPNKFGPDVCHLNLHKTFCIPHGGGGPGVGPIGVASHLKEFLPTHKMVPECGPKNGIGAIASAPWGSASILPISWGYIAMMGSEGLKKATQVAILSANYIAKKLEPYYPVLYRGKNNFVAHECIIDVRQFKSSANITVDDIAKRLMDYGFHAPTMSWPVVGTLMIEPTESESLEELDLFCDAMISIRNEIKEIESGKADKQNNLLKNAPHSLNHLVNDKWDYPYGRQKAFYPKPWVKEHKFWVPVGRVDNAYGDRNLVCSCPSVEEY